MGWTAGELDGPFSARAAIAFDLGDEFAERVVDAALKGNVVYAAVRSRDGDDVFGLVLLTERTGGILYTKPVSEDMGPAEVDCPPRILAQLTTPSNELARAWRGRCRARLARPRPRRGDVVMFARAIEFTDGSRHSRLTYRGGSRFSVDGHGYYVPKWSGLEYAVERASQ